MDGPYRRHFGCISLQDALSSLLSSPLRQWGSIRLSMPVYLGGSILRRSTPERLDGLRRLSCCCSISTSKRITWMAAYKGDRPIYLYTRRIMVPVKHKRPFSNEVDPIQVIFREGGRHANHGPMPACDLLDVDFLQPKVCWMCPRMDIVGPSLYSSAGVRIRGICCHEIQALTAAWLNTMGLHRRNKMTPDTECGYWDKMKTCQVAYGRSHEPSQLSRQTIPAEITWTEWAT
jgi:hypothetical protein